MSEKSLLRERLERLGPVRDVDRVSSGFAFLMVIKRMTAETEFKAVSAAMTLARRGLSLAASKEAVEQLLDNGSVRIAVPTVESVTVLSRDLEACGALILSNCLDPGHRQTTAELLDYAKSPGVIDAMAESARENLRVAELLGQKVIDEPPLRKAS